MPGYFAACPANAVDVGSIIVPFSRDRDIVQCTPSLCTVRCSFSSIRSAPDSRASFPYRTPPISLSFLLLLVTRPPARLPCRADPLSSPLFPPPSLTQGAQHVQSYLHSGVLLPTSILHYKYPWSLFFFFIPIPLAFSAELRNPVDSVKLGS